MKLYIVLRQRSYEDTPVFFRACESRAVADLVVSKHSGVKGTEWTVKETDLFTSEDARKAYHLGEVTA